MSTTFDYDDLHIAGLLSQYRQIDGLPMYRDQYGEVYATLTGTAHDREEALRGFIEHLRKFLNGRDIIVWRTKPHLIREDDGCYKIRCRLTAYSELPEKPTQEMDMATGMEFGQALTCLRNGHKVCRMGWNGRGMWAALQMPDAGSKMTLPYFYMKTADGQLVPWLPSQTDILATDWWIA